MTRLTFQSVTTTLLVFSTMFLTLISKVASAEEELFEVVTVEKGNSSKETLQAAMKVLPLNQLTPGQRREIQPILSNTSMFRRLPTISLQVEPEVYQFFAMHPETAVSIWQVLEISQFTMRQVNETNYVMNSGDGSSGTVTSLYRTPKQQLVLAKGELKSPFLLKPIRAHALLHLQTEFSQDQQGNRWATHRVDLFVEFPSQTVETAAKMMSPMSNRVMDKNFEEVSLFLHVMSQAMKFRPGWVSGLARKMEGVVASRKTELESLTEEIYMSGLDEGATTFIPIPKNPPQSQPNR